MTPLVAEASPNTTPRSTFDRMLHTGSAALGVVAASSLVVLMLATVADVLVRSITRSSLPGMIEIAETALVASVFLGLAWTSIQGGHVAVTIVTDRLSPRIARVVSTLVWALSSGVLAWMSVALFVRAAQSTSASETRFGLVQWPIWPMRWIIAVGVVLWTVVALVNLTRALRGRVPYGEETEAVLDA